VIQKSFVPINRLPPRPRSHAILPLFKTRSDQRHRRLSTLAQHPALQTCGTNRLFWKSESSYQHTFRECLEYSWNVLLNVRLIPFRCLRDLGRFITGNKTGHTAAHFPQLAPIRRRLRFIEDFLDRGAPHLVQFDVTTLRDVKRMPSLQVFRVGFLSAYCSSSSRFVR